LIRRVIENDSETRPRKLEHFFRRERGSIADDRLVECCIIPPIGGDGTQFARHMCLTRRAAQLALVVSIDRIISLQRFAQWIRFRLAKTKMQMSSPPLGMFETLRHSAKLQRLVFHRQQKRAQALA